MFVLVTWREYEITKISSDGQIFRFKPILSEIQHLYAWCIWIRVCVGMLMLHRNLYPLLLRENKSDELKTLSECAEWMISVLHPTLLWKSDLRWRNYNRPLIFGGFYHFNATCCHVVGRRPALFQTEDVGMGHFHWNDAIYAIACTAAGRGQAKSWEQSYLHNADKVSSCKKLHSI